MDPSRLGSWAAPLERDNSEMIPGTCFLLLASRKFSRRRTAMAHTRLFQREIVSQKREDTLLCLLVAIFGFLVLILGFFFSATMTYLHRRLLWFPDGRWELRPTATSIIPGPLHPASLRFAHPEGLRSWTRPLQLPCPSGNWAIITRTIMV